MFPSPTELIVTMTMAIGKDGSIYQDTQTYGNKWSQVYKGIVEIRDKLIQQVNDKKTCPFNPKNLINGDSTFDGD